MDDNQFGENAKEQLEREIEELKRQKEIRDLQRQKEELERKRPSYFSYNSSTDYQNAVNQWEANKKRLEDRGHKGGPTGVALLSVGVIIEVGSIIYGFVMPTVHLKRARANAVASNDTGFKFNLAYTSSGDIAPQLSYKIRY